MTRKLTFPILSLLVAAVLPLAASAQGFYDDDIYDSGKKKTTTVKQTKSASRTAADPIPSLSGTGFYYGGDGNIYAEYPAADSYSYNSGNVRDVDEYNRRGFFARSGVDSIPADSLADYFAYTRRLEKFHNPDVVSGSSDADLQAYYYESQPANVNIYVNNSPFYNPWGWNSFYSPWPSWSFSWGYYRPWSWSWGWGYDPYWDWAWGGPSWSWGWSWGGPAWGWGGPAWGWAPAVRPAYHTGIGSSGTRRPVGQVRPGSGTLHAGRPASGVAGTNNSGYRPGAGVTRPVGSNIGSGSSNGGQRPGASSVRPGYIQNQRPGSGTSTGSRPGVTTRPVNNNNNSGFNYNNTGNQGSRNTYSRPASSSGGSRSSGSSAGSRTGGSSGGSRGTRR